MKTAKAWAIVNKRGTIYIATVNYSRKYCLSGWLVGVTDSDRAREWRQDRAKGFRCIKVTIAPLGENDGR